MFRDDGGWGKIDKGRADLVSTQGKRASQNQSMKKNKKSRMGDTAQDGPLVIVGGDKDTGERGKKKTEV